VGQTSGFGRLGLKTAGYYTLTSLLAILVGLAVVDVVQPGIVDGEPAKDRISLSAETKDVAERVEGRGGQDVVEVFLRMIPENVLASAAENDMLGVIFFSLVFGYFMTRVSERPKQALADFWQGVYEVMLRMTDWVMLFAPIGVFALAAKVVIDTGFGALTPLLVFVLSVVAALSLHVFVTLSLLLRFVARVNPLRHFSVMMPAIFMAFSTASSSATLPLTMER